MEDEQVRSLSPPLPGKGYYNFDFDAVDGNIAPCPAGKEIKLSSPPVITKDLDSSLQSRKEATPEKKEAAQDDNKLLTEAETTPKKRKSKSSSSSSSKHSSAPDHNAGSQDSGSGHRVDGLSVSQDGTAEKPVKHRKSGKKTRSTRPMSQSYSEQCSSERRTLFDEPTAMSASIHEALARNNSSNVPEDSTSAKELSKTEQSPHRPEKGLHRPKKISSPKKVPLERSDSVRSQRRQSSSRKVPRLFQRRHHSLWRNLPSCRKSTGHGQHQ
ncbi:uncharacterized protein LOC143293915 [Babylonia areolata]|uniref:uncharacterized protein LOC143293915 n=1 Tax=Babylonia areolata TaxID=304850 RepID=UPI003FCFE5AA